MVVTVVTCETDTLPYFDYRWYLFVIYVFLEQANSSTTWECKMASASSTSARNLFQDSKTRLSERVQVG